MIKVKNGIAEMTKNPVKSRLSRLHTNNVDCVDNVDYFSKSLKIKGKIGQKKSTFFKVENGLKKCGLVENYLATKSFAIFTTSPAPIVINRSPLVQFSKTNFLISEKSEI